MPILVTENLTKRFGSLVAVDKLSITVEAGEVFGLLGPNGAGKTTTIKMLTTLISPTSGKAWVAGYDIVRQSSAVRRKIGYVPQLISADGSLSGYENILLFAKLYDIPSKVREQLVRDTLEMMGLTDAADKLVKNYSGGMIRRLEIAESMLHHPKLLFMDEPTIGLDPLARKTVWDHVARLKADFGTTILLTTHMMEEAESLCSRVAIMHNGKIVAIGTPADLVSSIGGENADLNDVFIHFTGDHLGEDEHGGTLRDISRTRRTAKRLG